MDLKDIPYEFILDLQFSSTITVLNILILAQMTTIRETTHMYELK